MSAEITHKFDRITGKMIQVVHPTRLRQILDENKESYERPDDFSPDDEWNTCKEYNNV